MVAEDSALVLISTALVDAQYAYFRLSSNRLDELQNCVKKLVGCIQEMEALRALLDGMLGGGGGVERLLCSYGMEVLAFTKL